MFHLPLSLITLGETGTALNKFLKRTWVKEAITFNGLEIEHLRYRVLGNALAQGGRDVVICEDHRVRDVMETVRQVPVSLRPGVVLTCPVKGQMTRRLVVPSGTAVYRLAQAASGGMAGAVD